MNTAENRWRGSVNRYIISGTNFNTHKMFEYEKIKGNLKWILNNSPKVVEDILRNGRTLENAHVKIEDWTRNSRTSEHWDLFHALKTNRVKRQGEIIDFHEWKAFWAEKEEKQREMEAEARLQKRIARARQAAIDEVRKRNPMQIYVPVIRQSSPPRIEVIDESSDDENVPLIQQSEPKVFGFNDALQGQQRADQNSAVCQSNVDCTNINCPLIHF